LTESQGTSWIDEQQEATLKGTKKKAAQRTVSASRGDASGRKCRLQTATTESVQALTKRNRSQQTRQVHLRNETLSIFTCHKIPRNLPSNTPAEEFSVALTKLEPQADVLKLKDTSGRRF
jgi:hypothetical protein